MDRTLHAACAAYDRRTTLAYGRDPKVAEDDNSDPNRVTLAQHIFGRAGVPGRHPPEPRTNDPQGSQAPPAAALHSPAAEHSSPAAADAEPVEAAAQPKQLKTAAELAEMIELDLARHPDCPRTGFRVTVYGGSHWRAMLTISPAAGSIRDFREWRDLTDDLAERLRAHYDLASD